MRLMLIALALVTALPAWAHGHGRHHHASARVYGQARVVVMMGHSRAPVPLAVPAHQPPLATAYRPAYQPQNGECVVGYTPDGWGYERAGSFAIVNDTPNPAVVTISGLVIMSADSGGQAITALMSKGTRGELEPVAVIPPNSICRGFVTVTSSKSVLDFSAQQLTVVATCEGGSTDMACATFASNGPSRSYRAAASAVSNARGFEGGVKLIIGR